MIDYFLYIKPTNKCQLQCKHCYTNSTIKDNEKLDIDKAIMFINKFCNEHKEDKVGFLRNFVKTNKNMFLFYIIFYITN